MSNTQVKLDMDNKLRITIKNSEPVGLNDLTDSLTGLANQYYDFIANDSKGQGKGVLYVSEIRKGSMIFDLVSEVLPYISLFAATVTPLEAWVDQFIKTIDWLRNKGEKPALDIDKKALKDIKNTFSPIAKDNASLMMLNLEGCNIQNVYSLSYTSEDAKKITSNAEMELKVLEKNEKHIYTNRLMVWDQSKFNLKATTGDKGLIESIYDKPVKIIFKNEDDKAYMYNAGKDFDGVPWQDLGFIIDVEVQYLNGLPKVYNVLNVHKAETFLIREQ